MGITLGSCAGLRKAGLGKKAGLQSPRKTLALPQARATCERAGISSGRLMASRTLLDSS